MVVDYSAWLINKITPQTYVINSIGGCSKTSHELLGVSNVEQLTSTVQKYTLHYLTELDSSPWTRVDTMTKEIGLESAEITCGYGSYAGTYKTRYSYDEVSLPIVLKDYDTGIIGVDFFVVSRTSYHTWNTQASKLPIFVDIFDFFADIPIGYVSISVISHNPFKVSFELEYPIGTIYKATKTWGTFPLYAGNLGETESTIDDFFQISGTPHASWSKNIGHHYISANFSLQILPPPEPPDIRTESIAVDDPLAQAHRYEIISITATLKNYGGKGSATLPVTVDGVEVGTIETDILDKDETVTISVPVTMPASLGDFEICI